MFDGGYSMTLAIIHNGEVLSVVYDLEDYNLDKPMARSEICDYISKAINILQKAKQREVNK